MENKIKKKKVIIILIITFLIFFLAYNGYRIYLINYSDEAKRINANIENIKKVNIGMDSNQVYKIMGKPDYYEKVKKKLYVEYSNGINSSTNIVIIIDSNGIVEDKMHD